MAVALPAPEVQTQKGQFAVVNASELLERLAYYGIVAINALYLDSLGYSAGTIGAISAVLLPLPYIVPLLTGALAEKLGYKPMMLVAFVFYASGFVILASSTRLAVMVCGIVSLGVGAGMFKPLTAASIAHLTSPSQRSMGYTLYYMGINVGGLLGPVIANFLDDQYRLAFLLGAGVMIVDFLLILLLFRNPTEPKRETNLLQSFRPLAEVIAHDGRFVLLLAIFSGYWFLYSMNFTFLSLFLDDFIALPDWFNPQLQQAIDPAFVILLGIPLGRYAERNNPVRMMTVGIVLTVIGFLFLALVAKFWAVVVGIVISTAGEVLAYPGFLGYVSRIAPKDRVAVYQGFGFLPLFVGFLLGPLLGGLLYEGLAKDALRPALFWSIMCAAAMLSVVAFLLYARYTTPREERRASGFGWVALALLAIPLMVGAGAVAGRLDRHVIPVEAPTVGVSFDVTKQAHQGDAIDIALPATDEENLTLRLTWFDSSTNNAPGTINQGDTFQVEVLDANGTKTYEATATNDVGTAGRIELVLQGDFLVDGATARITLTGTGDIAVSPGGGLPLAPVAIQPDEDNSFRLQLVS